MRTLLSIAALLTVAGASDALAQTATQTVSAEVQAINQISLGGTPSLTITAATAGSAPTTVTASATYAITTNETSKKVTASIDSDMPSGTTLSAALAAPSGATSAGATQLSTTAADVVTGISTVNESGLNITYTLTATVAAGVVPSLTRTVTYTIVAGS